MWQRVVALMVLALVAHRTADAQDQPELRLEGGYALIHQRGYEDAGAALLSVHWHNPREAFTLLAGANFTLAQDSLAAAQGVAAISIPWRAHPRLRTEAGLAGASFSLRKVGRGGNGNVFVRQHLVGAARGAWTGLGLGTTGRDGVTSQSWSVDAGVWQTIRSVYFGASLARQSSGDWPLLIASGVANSHNVARYELLDAQVAMIARNGPHEFSLTLTSRHGMGATESDALALMATGVLQLHERFALVASGGSQLADPLRGLPTADLATISGRVSLGPKPLPVMQRSLIAEATVVEITGGGGELIVRVFAAPAVVVDIAGDFSGWVPLPVTRDGPIVTARATLPTGKHRVAVRVNGGEWRAPANLARVRDDYGGEAGLVIVP